MVKKTWLGLVLFVVVFGFTTACSKQLTPPEIEATSSASEADIGAGDAASEEASAFRGGAGDGFNISEEGVSESGGFSGSMGSGSDFGSGSEAAPFAGSGGMGGADEGPGDSGA